MDLSLNADRSTSSRKSALILKLGQIGDVTMAIPAAHALSREGFDIDWVCGKAARPLLECYSWINLIPVDDKAILLGNPRERITNILGLWKRLRRKRYDLCATLYYDKRFQILVLPVRAKRKLILSSKSRETALLAGRYHTDEYARVLLGMEDSCRDQGLTLVSPDYLPPSPWPDKSTACRVAIVPGGTNNLLRQQTVRRWPIESYVALAEMLLARDWEVVLIGGQEDEWVKPHFRHLAVRDSIATLNLPEVISASNSCDAVVTHDTGPMHLAGLSNTCLVSIFGPTDPGNFSPRRAFVASIWGGRGFACRPCYDGRNFAACTFNGCMHQVKPEEVLRELDQLLDDRAKGRSSAWRVVSPEQNLFSNEETFVILP